MEVFNGFLQEHFDKIHGYELSNICLCCSYYVYSYYVYSYNAVYIMFIYITFQVFMQSLRKHARLISPIIYTSYPTSAVLANSYLL